MADRFKAKYSDYLQIGNIQVGLDITHGAWQGAYSSFAKWRLALAEAAGVTLHSVWPGYEHDHLMGIWEELPSDSLIVLLQHYDDEGSIPLDCLPALIERLERLMPYIQGEHCKEWTRTFIAGCQSAIRAGERLEFW